MLICNARKHCSKREECPHAIKHFPTPDCLNKAECPTDTDRVRIRCKNAGASIQRVARKSMKNLNKVKRPLTQYEVQQGLAKLKKISYVEYRMSGGSISDLNNINTMQIIQGVTSVHLKTIFPDYISRGLDRNKIINAFVTEAERQVQVSVKRMKARRIYDHLVKTTKEREYIIQKILNNNVHKWLKYNYDIRSGKYYLHFSLKRNQDNITEPKFEIYGKCSHTSHYLKVPRGMCVREISRHLVVCDYSDKKSKTFPCFALAGGRKGFAFFLTSVVDEKLVDPFFMTDSKHPIKTKTKRGGL